MYRVDILPRVNKVLTHLPQVDYARVLAAIQNLSNDPRPPGCTKLTNRDAWRIRVGVYRVIYEIADDQLVVTVVDAGHRRDVYR